MTTTLIRGGLIVTSDNQAPGDVLVADGRVALVGRALDDGTADAVIDAAGCYVMPGAIDPHTHLEMPFGGTTTIDDFTSGTIAAACGGTTAIVDFCLQEHGQPLREALEAWREKARRCPPAVDVGFHIGIVDLEYPGALDELATLPREEGVPSFKLFMAYKGALMVDDETMMRAMQVAAASGGLAMVHAENGGAIARLVEVALERGDTEPRFHATTRPAALEAEATHRAIEIASVAGCPLYVVHVSGADALAEVDAARARGRRVWAETCTQYLFATADDLARPDFEGAKYVFTPPPRTVDDQEALWAALAGGRLDALTSDHCPFRWADQKTLGRDDFSKIPNGAPGIEERVALLHHFGCRERGLPLPRMVHLLSTAPARLFGLHPRKGTIAPGADADIVVFDPEQRRTLSADTLHSRVDYSLYEGVEVQGAVRDVVVRGMPVVRDGEPVDAPPRGELVARAPFGSRLPMREEVTA